MKTKRKCESTKKRLFRLFRGTLICGWLAGVLALLAPFGALAEVFVSDSGSAEVTFTETSIVYTFKQSSSISITGSGEAEVLIVGGGGGGGGYNYFVGGGGGGGGVYHATNTLVYAGTYPVKVGAGAEESTELGKRGLYGGDSSVFGITALGGAGGQGGNSSEWQTFPSQTKAGNGGGGTVSANNGTFSASQSAYRNQVDTGYHGNDGGAGYALDGTKYAGGGGAGSVGVAGSEGGKGGDGYPCDISGTLTYYGGGGGGGERNSPAVGGQGGGGAAGEAGVDGFGGGGGGAKIGIAEKNYNQGYSTRGGSGVVIVRYRVLPRIGTVLIVK